MFLMLLYATHEGGGAAFWFTGVTLSVDLFFPARFSLSLPLILIACSQTPVRCIWGGETFLPLSTEVMGTGNSCPYQTAGSQLMFMLLWHSDGVKCFYCFCSHNYFFKVIIHFSTSDLFSFTFLPIVFKSSPSFYNGEKKAIAAYM